MNIVILCLGIITGILFILPLLLFGMLNAGNAMGLLLGTALIFWGIFFRKTILIISELFRHTSGRIILTVVSIILLAAIIFVLTATVKMVSAACNAPEKETTVVVLGCRVYQSGPSLTLVTRLRATLDFLEENPRLKCVLSGGKGDDEPVSEAQAMKNWLTARGIDEDRLYLEEKSTSTWENIRFSKKLIEEEGLCPAITVITSEFHQYRAKQIAESCDMECYAISGKTPFYLLPTYYLRELGGVLTEMLGIF